jgi:hypothetical protein
LCILSFTLTVEIRENLYKPWKQGPAEVFPIPGICCIF